MWSSVGLIIIKNLQLSSFDRGRLQARWHAQQRCQAGHDVGKGGAPARLLRPAVPAGGHFFAADDMIRKMVQARRGGDRWVGRQVGLQAAAARTSSAGSSRPAQQTLQCTGPAAPPAAATPAALRPAPCAAPADAASDTNSRRCLQWQRQRQQWQGQPEGRNARPQALQPHCTKVSAPSQQRAPPGMAVPLPRNTSTSAAPTAPAQSYSNLRRRWADGHPVSLAPAGADGAAAAAGMGSGPHCWMRQALWQCRQPSLGFATHQPQRIGGSRFFFYCF